MRKNKLTATAHICHPSTRTEARGSQVPGQPGLPNKLHPSTVEEGSWECSATSESDKTNENRQAPGPSHLTTLKSQAKALQTWQMKHNTKVWMITVNSLYLGFSSVPAQLPAANCNMITWHGKFQKQAIRNIYRVELLPLLYFMVPC